MSALIFPVKEICEKAKELGLLTIVDGAHVPGQIPLNLQEIKADIYTGACHKWLLTPKGCSFLYANKTVQNDYDPVIISWGYDADVKGASDFLDYHQQQGTRDYSAFLTIPAALNFRKQNNWDDVSLKAKQLILNNYEDLCSIFGTKPICPVTDEFLGQMCSVPVPVADPQPLKNLLFDSYKIEIPVFRLGEQVFLRLATQAYVSQTDIDYLKHSLIEIRDTTNIIQ